MIFPRVRRPCLWRPSGGSCRIWARSSAGEHYGDIVGVVGSNPTAPTTALAADVLVQNKTQLAISAEVPSLILIAPRGLDQVRQPTVLQLEGRDVDRVQHVFALEGDLLQLGRFGVDACA